MDDPCGFPDIKLVECSVPPSPLSNIVFPIVSTVSSFVVHGVAVWLSLVECRRNGRRADMAPDSRLHLAFERPCECSTRTGSSIMPIIYTTFWGRTLNGMSTIVL